MSDLFDEPFEEPEPEPAGPALPPPAPRRHIFTITELTADIRGLLEDRFGEIWVEGEISNCRLWNTGHMYFTLKDGGAQMKAVIFRSALKYLKFKPEDGQHVVARGRISVYEPKGEYQIVCEHLEPHGLGALQLAFEQLKRRLQQEGLFKEERKRPLPTLPRKIAIVTSLEGAAIRDIIKVLSRRYRNLHLVIRPVRVQGDGAAAEVAEGLRAAARVRGVDLIIVGRGGGSIEDLWAFNQEPVARAIAASPVPVISAVGHEVDVTIADFVADVRAPTPSAAAEIVAARKDEFCHRVDRLRDRAGVAITSRIQRLQSRVHQAIGRRGMAGWTARFGMRGRHAAELTHDLRRVAQAGLARRERRYHALRLRLESHDLRRRFALIRTRLQQVDARLAAVANRAHHRHDARLRVLAGRLGTLSPLAVLGRGYALCWDEDHTVLLRDAAAVPDGATVKVTLQRGELTCEVRDRTVER